MARLAEPGQTAGPADGDELTFADVPEHLRPSSRHFLDQLPDTPNPRVAEHTIAAYGLSPDELAAGSVGRRSSWRYWRHLVADAHREIAYAQWLFEQGVIDWDPRTQVDAANADIRSRLGDLADEVGPARPHGRTPWEWSPWAFSLWETDRRRAVA